MAIWLWCVHIIIMCVFIYLRESDPPASACYKHKTFSRIFNLLSYCAIYEYSYGVPAALRCLEIITCHHNIYDGILKYP